MFAVLDRGKEYIVYCHSGRRSAAAAFLFAQRGFKVWLLDGGLRTVEKGA
jgi:rhodanese-related sulfurtransferase